MRTNEEIVNILKEEKDKQSLSISELARRVNMAKSAISRYFNYTREFPLNRAVAYYLTDATTPVKLTAKDMMGTEYGSFEYKLN